LRELRLHNNKISEIKGLEELKNLQYLQLWGNHISNPQLGYDNNLYVVQKYISDLKQKKIYIKLPAKVMLLGNHGAGKSTFLEYLETGELPTNQKSTHILSIVPYHYENAGNDIKLPKALFYDFGGQDYYHGLYRAFFSDESINLLLWRSETNKNNIRKAEDETDNFTRDYTVAYWLSQPQLSNPILLIQTHADKELRERVNDIPASKVPEEEYYVSLNKEKTENDTKLTSNLNNLKVGVNYQIDKKREKPVEKNYYYSSFLQFILDYPDEKYIRVKENILDKGHYGRTKLENETENDLLTFLQVELDELSKAGLVLYYKNNDKLNNIVWLNPTKTITYIHNKILTKELMKEYKGIIDENDFNGFCKETERESFEKIKELLIEQKVIFYDKHEKQYIIPMQLPLSENDSNFEMNKFDFSKPKFVLKFKNFIPFGLINQLICLYGGQPDIKKFWRDQLMFTFNGKYKVWMQLNFENLEIAVHICPKEGKTSHLSLPELEKLIFMNIIDLYNGEEIEYYWDNDKKLHLKYEETMVLVDNDGTYIVDNNNNFISLGTHTQDTIEEYIQREQVNTPEDLYISVDEMLFLRHRTIEEMQENQNTVTVYPKDYKGEIDEKNTKTDFISKYIQFTNNKNITSMKKIFVSYSKKDKAEMQEFIKHTITLQEQGLIAKPWEDEWISFGKEWNKEIKKQIKDCDIMVCLISADFLNTEYIRKVELQQAMEQNKILVPIIIKPCDWEYCDFAKYQVALKGKCISLNENQEYIIKENTDIEKAKFWVEIIKEMRKKIFNTQN